MAPEKKELTPEEKLAKAEIQARKAEEARKKKDEVTKARLLQRQKAEEQYNKENAWKVHSEWRKILRVAKAEELQNEVQSLYEKFRNEVLRKDSSLASLMNHLEEAEEQQHWAFSKHLQVIDGLLDTHRSRTKDMEEEFQEQLEILQRDLNTERAYIMSMHEKQKKELCDMMNAMDNDFKESESELRQEFESCREEIKNKSTEEYNVLKLSLEGVIDELQSRIEEIHQAYLGSTDAKTQAFRKMVERDKITARFIEQRMRKLIYLHDSISYRRAKISNDSREWEYINKSLRDRKDEINKHYQELKRKLSKHRGREHNELKAMSRISEEARSTLQNKLHMAERIIKLGQLNSKLQTEQERIAPFHPLLCSTIVKTPTDTLVEQLNANCDSEIDVKREDDQSILTSLSRNENSNVLEDLTHDNVNPFQNESNETVLRLSSYATDESGNEIEESNYLSKFYKCYNKVMLDKVTLEIQKRKLNSENNILRGTLQQYIKSATLSNKLTKRVISLLAQCGV